MKKNLIISLSVVLVVILGAYFLIQNNKKEATETQTPDNSIAVGENSGTVKLDDKTITEQVPIKNNNNTNKKTMTATLHTNKGDITVEFFAKDAPNTVANFTKLAKEGFYDGVKFHRVIKGFMIQAGDPLSKDDTKMAFWGTGGPGYQFKDEIDPKSDLYTKVGYVKGILAMANSGPNTNGSQFFIMNENNPLPPLYTIFGKVDAGQDVVDKIASVPTVPGDRPVDPVIINSITLN
jgi:cyclophilin family peptidyl-prolyl cis-trans isomerase